MERFTEQFWSDLETRGYARNGHATDDGYGWWVRPPGTTSQSPLDGSLGGPVWEVTEHDDGTITVHPSIWLDRGLPGEWHGHLRQGVWSEA